LSDSEPIIDFRPVLAGRTTRGATSGTQGQGTSHPNGVAREASATTTFDRRELSEILRIYGRFVASGEWRDYAIDMGRETAVFSIFRRSSECPIYRIEKTPKLARRQGMYAVVAASGSILKRGPDLRRVLAVLDRSLKLVTG
jgi:hypothetical protein